MRLSPGGLGSAGGAVLSEEDLGFEHRVHGATVPKGTCWVEKFNSWMYKVLEHATVEARHRWVSTQDAQMRWTVELHLRPRASGAADWEVERVWCSSPHRTKKEAREEAAAMLLWEQWQAGRLPNLVPPSGCPHQDPIPSVWLRHRALGVTRARPAVVVPIAKQPGGTQAPAGAEGAAPPSGLPLCAPPVASPAFGPPPPAGCPPAPTTPASQWLEAGSAGAGGDLGAAGGQLKAEEAEEAKDAGLLPDPSALGLAAGCPATPAPPSPAADPEPSGSVPVAGNRDDDGDFLKSDDWSPLEEPGAGLAPAGAAAPSAAAPPAPGPAVPVDPIAEAARRAIERCSQPSLPPTAQDPGLEEGAEG